MSVCLFVPYLLWRLQADQHQTWQEGRGQTRKTPRGTRFHGNQCVVIATKKGDFYGQIRTVVGYKIACDGTVQDVTSPMTSCDITLAVTSWKPSTCIVVSRHLGASTVFWVT